MTFKAIVAMDNNRTIGDSKSNDLPWRFSKDFKWFKKNTMGTTIVMGRKTWDSIGQPLPHRNNIILSRRMQDDDVLDKDVKIYRSIDILLDNFESGYVIGGAEIFKLFYDRDLIDEVLLTRIDGNFHGDVKLPDIEGGMKLIHETSIIDKNKIDGKDYKLNFEIYKK